MKKFSYVAMTLLLSGMLVAQTGTTPSDTKSDPASTSNPADQQTDTTSNPAGTDQTAPATQPDQPTFGSDRSRDSSTAPSSTDGAPMSEQSPTGTTSTNPVGPDNSPSSTEVPPVDNPQPPNDRVPGTNPDGTIQPDTQSHPIPESTTPHQ